uniref:vacuolar-sorting protein SNF8 isoform X2 n=1 Tax=Myxine glutinosa TaxID=7769 RepID=UPI00359015B5
MRRRGVGAGAIAKRKLEEMSKQLETFRGHLEQFASKRKQDIRKNPQFRMQFQNMCATIGVDPLASGKGFWSEMLGVGDFYYELGVQIVEVCLALRHRDGGLMMLEELHKRVLKSRGKLAQDVSQDDLIRAIKKLKVLGNGFSMIQMGGSYLVQSVPAELNMDHTTVLQLAEANGYTSAAEVKAALKWEPERIDHVLTYLLREGLAWLDMQATDGPQYWFPALCSKDAALDELNETSP